MKLYELLLAGALMGAGIKTIMAKTITPRVKAWEDFLLPQNRELPKRARKPKGIVVHTTGRGLLEQAKKRGNGDLKKGALAWYAGTGMSYYGEFIIFHDGTVVRLAPEDKMTWHSADIPASSPENLPAWWRERWPGLTGPVDILGTEHINSNSIGIDLLPTADATFTAAQLSALAAVVEKLRAKWGPLRVVGHEDVDPVRRGTPKPWDPGTINLRRFN